MTWNDFKEQMEKSSPANSFYQKIQAALLSIVVTIGLWASNEIYINSKNIAVLSEDLTSLATTIKTHDDRQDAIVERLIVVQQEEGKEIAALQQALRDESVNRAAEDRSHGSFRTAK